MRVVTILGARPNFIKAFLISHELEKRGHEEIIIHTGQHYDFEMSEAFFQDLKIPTPSYNLNLKGDQINEMIKRIGNILKEKQPDLILIYGDTNSSLAGAMAGWYNNIKIAHVEAGERCFDMEMPEERNRIIIDHYATWLFCPTRIGLSYAKKEGKTKALFTGNVMYDALSHYEDIIDSQKACRNYGFEEKKYVVLTLHRQQNVDSKENLLHILEGLKKVKIPILFPVHPRTKQRLEEYNLMKEYQEIVQMTDPVKYLSMLSLISDSSFVITDSGGVQTDAYCLKTPCITLLEKSGWQETVDLGWNRLVGRNMNKLEEGITTFEKDPPTKHKEIFGNGKAYLQIIEILERDNK